MQPTIHQETTAQGMLGLSTSVRQLGSVLVDMQKNVDDLQQYMGTVKPVREQLSGIVSNYHAQFADIIRDHSYTGLVNKMKEKVLVVKAFDPTTDP